MWGRGFPPAKMSESIGDNPNRRLSHAGIAAGGFAHYPRPSSRRRQASSSSERVVEKHFYEGAGRPAVVERGSVFREDFTRFDLEKPTRGHRQSIAQGAHGRQGSPQPLRR